MSKKPKSVDQLTDKEFVAGWKAVTGEPPAALLEDRSEMIQMILDGSPPPLAHEQDATLYVATLLPG